MNNSNDNELCNLTIREAGGLIQRRDLSPVELTDAHLQRIQELDGRLKSFVALEAEEALAEARVAEAEIQRGNYRGPLHGIPVAHKDQFDSLRLPSRARLDADELVDVIPDATPIHKLREAGAVTLGKLDMDGWEVRKPPTPPRERPRNPWDLSRSPGGSSGGSGAALAAGLCMASMGEDSGGSIRFPSSVCGVVGMKPTYGLVSRFGLLPLSWSLDHAGPMTRTVEDNALVLQAVAGHDEKDPTSLNVVVPDYSASIGQDVRGITIGVPRDYIEKIESPMNPEVMPAVEKALKDLEGMGARVEEVQIPSLELGPAAMIFIWYAETASARKKDLQARPEIFTDAVHTILYHGNMIHASDYLLAQQARTRLRREYAEAFSKVDLMVLPTTPFPAPRSEEYVPILRTSLFALTHFLGGFNVTGTPALSVPCGFNSAGLPLGIQFLGRAMGEPTVYRVAYAYQQHAGWHLRRPDLGVDHIS